MDLLWKKKFNKAIKILDIKKIFMPLTLSILFFCFLIYRDKNFNIEKLYLIKTINPKSFCFAILMLFLRDSLYVLRIRLIANRKLSWVSCLFIIILWEFSSAVTPSAIGGGFIAVFLFLKEGIKLGEAIAYVLACAIFDNYFFLFAIPLSYIGLLNNYEFFNNNIIFTTFWISYCFIFIYALCMSCILFIKPEIFKMFVIKITNIKLLNRFQKKAVEQCEEIINSSKILKRHGFVFWLFIFIITSITWFSRYVILNFIIDGFINLNFYEHISILCKHLVVWITMLISPTPGGSGFIEYAFNCIFNDILGNYTIIISIIWRLLTYYFYLLLGLLILPNWIKGIRKKHNTKKKEEVFPDDGDDININY